MQRRDFLSKTLAAAAGSALMMKAKLPLSGQNTVHPLYFDGLTYLSDNKEDVKKCGLSGFIWDVSDGEEVQGKFVRQMIPSLKTMSQTARFLKENDQGLFLATRGSQVKEAFERGQIAVFFQFQSAEPVTSDLGMLDVYYELGLRILQLTYHHENIFGGGCLVKDSEWTGLTPLGFGAVEKMNALGIIPDLSHGNENVGLDVLKTSKKPVIISHTGCRAIVNNARCAPDSLIKGVADSGGVVGIFAMSFWLTNDPLPTVDSYIDQLAHVIKIGGIDAVGVSNDYTIAGELDAQRLNNDNAKAVLDYLPFWKELTGVLGFDRIPQHCVIPELNNIERCFTIQAGLEKRRYTSTQVEKIMGGNWVRMLTESLG